MSEPTWASQDRVLDMAWVVLVNDDRGSAEAYDSEAEAVRAAEDLSERAEPNVWIVVADQSTGSARVIKQGSIEG